MVPPLIARPLVRQAGEFACPMPLRGLDQAKWESFSGASDGVGQIAVVVGHHRCADCPDQGVDQRARSDVDVGALLLLSCN